MKFRVQQIQLGKVLKNEKKTKEALDSMRKAQYQGIELDGFMIRKSPFIVKALPDRYGMPIKNAGKLNWKRLVEEANLEVISIHEDLERLEKKHTTITRKESF